MSTEAVPLSSTRASRASGGPRTQERVTRGITFIVLLALSCMLLMPLAWMLSTSLKRASEVFVVPLQWIPPHVTWSNYPQAVHDFPFWTCLKNSLIYGVGSTVLTLISSALVAYSFARLRWRGRDLFFILTLATMM